VHTDVSGSAERGRTALANLRTAEVWIQETVSDLESLADDVRKNTEHIAPDIVQQNWVTLIQYQKGVQAQIEGKSEEMKTLVNGPVFASQLLREQVAILAKSVVFLAAVLIIGVVILAAILTSFCNTQLI
jgi:uncharacterized Zn finger protein